MEDSKGKNIKTLENFASQVGDSNFNEDSLLSLTKNLKLLFNCEEATLFALDEVKLELFTKNFHKEGFPEIRMNISVKNIAGFVAATGKSLCKLDAGLRAFRGCQTGDSSANILIQREDDETTILVRVLKDGSRFVYQQIDPPQDVIKLIKEIANIDLDLLPKPHRRKDDPRY